MLPKHILVPTDLSESAEQALDFTIDVLAAMGMDCTVDWLENDPEDPPEDIRLEIEGKDAGRVIGKKGQTLAALQFQDRLMPLHDALFCEPSPGPVKFAASLMGKTTERCRLPLAPLMGPTRERVRAAMTEVGLLN